VSRSMRSLLQVACQPRLVAESLLRHRTEGRIFYIPALQLPDNAHRHAVCSLRFSFTPTFRRSQVMLSWALAFFIIAIIAAVFGFTGIAAGAAEIAKILFVVFVVLFLVSLVAGLLRRP
jgi:uncharacterized membrane protein YtjA (UPF0391 family)